MWRFLQRETPLDVCRSKASRVLGAAAGLTMAVLACSLISTPAAQDASPALPRIVQEQLDSLASHVADQIRLSKIDPEPTKFFVFDFTNASDKQCSKLGALLAEHFSSALAKHADSFVVLDHQLLTSYLKDNWIDQKEIQGLGIALALARFIGATGILRGDLREDPDNQLLLTLSLEGFGPVSSVGEVIAANGEMRALLKDPLPAFERSSPIPAEPGVLAAGLDGVGVPECIYCPPPLYSDAARAAKYQGTIVLSVDVTSDGRSDSILVLKGAPFMLNKQAIETVQKWKFKPAEKNGKAVPVRVPVEITLRLN
jgi:TonB family protein